MNDETLHIRLAGVPIQTPIYQNEARTREIADEVQERLKAIEASSPRIDTQAFALRVAMELAIELTRAQDEREEEARELVKALSRIADQLQHLNREYGR